MATLRTIRLRIRGTKNIKQITRAMEAVSAVKMRKSQTVALAARPYATAALNILKNVTRDAARMDTPHSFLKTPQNGEILLLVVTSDKGLAGSFNANVLKKAMESLEETEKRGKKVRVIAVGKRATEFFQKRRRMPEQSFRGLGDSVDLKDIGALFQEVAGLAKNYEAVHICYTNFLSVMKQEVVVRQLLPFSEKGLEEMVGGIVPEKGRFAERKIDTADIRTNGTSSAIEYLFEPSPKDIFDAMLPALLKIQVYHAILEANASEHSSRMVAMRSATDNAGELIKRYTVSQNKARQAAINKELAEITGGSEALAS